MSEAITINSQSIAEQLNEWQVRNYDPHELSLQGEYEIAFTNPALYGQGASSLAHDSSRLTMFASEQVLSREWNTAEEDEAWAHL
jgi:hypothetical protein